MQGNSGSGLTTAGFNKAFEKKCEASYKKKTVKVYYLAWLFWTLMIIHFAEIIGSSILELLGLNRMFG
jgi:ABC-type Fe3+-hydroxamate transport system substrate-binding protein